MVKCYILACQGDDYERQLKEQITGSVNNYAYDLDNTGIFAPYNVKDTLEHIGDAVENYLPSRGKKAKIVLMGYPRIFDGHASSDPLQPSSPTIQFSAAEMEMLNRLSDYMATEEPMTAALKAAGEEVSFANPISGFGIHGACDDDPWILPVNFNKTGEGDFGDLFDGCISDGLRCAEPDVHASEHKGRQRVRSGTSVSPG